MRNIHHAIVAAILLLIVAPVLAANKYVDSGCTHNGDGSAIDCAASVGQAGPWKTMENARTSWACGDTVNIRGVHATHGSNHAAGTTDGRYGTADFVRVDNACSSGTPLIIQAYGWTAAGAATQESVYLDGTDDPGAWTQCTWTNPNCNSPCAGITTQAACEGTWYVNAAGTMNNSIGAQKPDGSMTPRQTALANVDVQYESYSDNTSGGNLFVYWGTGNDAPGGSNNPKPYVFHNNNGEGFYFGITTDPSFVTIRGFTIRCVKAAGIYLEGEDITIQDMKIFYASDFTVGDDYAIQTIGKANRVWIDSNEFAYTGAETVHLQAYCIASDCVGSGNPCKCCTGAGAGATCGATVVNVTNNYMHDPGDTTVMGPASGSTPSGMIAGNHSGSSDHGDYTGSTFQGNIVKNTNAGTSCGRGVILENVSSNWIIRDNWFENTYGPAVKIEANSGGPGCNGNKIFNNVFYNTDTGGGCGEGATTIFLTSGGGTGTLDSNVISNNTFVDGANSGIDGNCNSQCTNLTVLNNIFYKSGTWVKQINWSDSTASNSFNHNLIWGPNVSSNTVATWKGVDKTCSTITGVETGNLCSDPVFVNSGINDYHIQTSSPAKDAGTTTGMPTEHDKDINNTITSDHGLPDYADNNTANVSPDMGADEFTSSGGGRHPLIVSLEPELLPAACY